MTKKEMILKVHETETLAVLAITGGGSEAISELLRHGNGSKTLLEAVVPYDMAAFNSFLGGKPDKYCDERVSRQLAMAAYQRARKLTGGEKPVIGVGASSSLVKENERAGREHHVYVALQTPTSTVSYSVRLDGHGHDRETEESIAADCILNAVFQGCGLPDRLNTLHSPSQVCAADGTAEYQKVVNDGTPHTINFNPIPEGSRLIFPGSFNPAHEGHAAIVAHAKKLTGYESCLAEISVRNVDKPPLDYVELTNRLNSVLAVKCFDGLIFTSAPLFADKAKLFKKDAFVIGSDTAHRISDCRYYADKDQRDRLMDEIGSREIHFLVYPRNGFTRADYDKLAPALRCYSYFVEDFEQVNVSSTEIRKNK